MTTVHRASLGALLCLLVAAPLAAQDTDEPSAFERIGWQTGPVLGDLGGEAQVQVPEGSTFLSSAWALRPTKNSKQAVI